MLTSLVTFLALRRLIISYRGSAHLIKLFWLSCGQKHIIWKLPLVIKLVFLFCKIVVPIRIWGVVSDSLVTHYINNIYIKLPIHLLQPIIIIKLLFFLNKLSKLISWIILALLFISKCFFWEFQSSLKIFIFLVNFISIHNLVF